MTTISTTAQSVVPKAKKVWRRLSVSQRNIVVAAEQNEGQISGKLRPSALAGLEDEGLVEGNKLTPLGHYVAKHKPE